MYQNLFHFKIQNQIWSITTRQDVKSIFLSYLQSEKKLQNAKLLLPRGCLQFLLHITNDEIFYIRCWQVTTWDNCQGLWTFSNLQWYTAQASERFRYLSDYSPPLFFFDRWLIGRNFSTWWKGYSIPRVENRW